MAGTNHYQVFLLSVLVTGLAVTVCGDDFTYKEGQFGAGDQVFANCTINIKGTSGKYLQLNTPFKTSTPGAMITYINVENNKPSGQKATISKIDGGLWKSSVTFCLTSVGGHGFLFQFYIYGRTPLGGPNEDPLLGNCMQD